LRHLATDFGLIPALGNRSNVAALPYVYSSAVYVADGGTVAGNVTLGSSQFRDQLY
jgi:hypothetical protein